MASKSDFDQARAAYESSQAAYSQAKASLDQAEESLRKTTIFSPMDGTVSQLNNELGERVLGTQQFQGTNVMTIADLSRMEARVDVSETDVVMVHMGDTARISVDAFPDRKVTALVYEVANTGTSKGAGTQEEVTNFEVRMRILDKDVSLRPGMSMTADIETETKQNILTVPIQSVTTRNPKAEVKPGEDAGKDGQVMPANNSVKAKSENKTKGDRLYRREWSRQGVPGQAGHQQRCLCGNHARTDRRTAGGVRNATRRSIANSRTEPRSASRNPRNRRQSRRTNTGIQEGKIHERH